MATPPVPKIFICHAHVDNASTDPRERWLDRVREHLAPFELGGEIEVFCDEVIRLGDDWHGRIQDQLRESRVALLLVSPAFMASRYIVSHELPVLLHRAHTTGLKIIPILIHPSAFQRFEFRYPDPKTGPDKKKLSAIQAAGSPRETLWELDEGKRDRILARVVDEVMDHLGTVATNPAPPPTKAPTGGDLPTPLPSTPAPAAAEEWTNSLGMKFVRVSGTEVRFCIWPTRVRDYQVFAEANPTVDGFWKDPLFQGVAVTPGPEHPVVNVSWEEANEFCDWLTEQELASGKLPRRQYYRLPTDLEWSAAVGLEGETGDTPQERDDNVPGVFPWGRQWPPPDGSGNFADESARRKFKDFKIIDGYRDGWPTTSPVGEFNPSKSGLYDLAGNVWEWCEDWYDDEKKYRVLRGGSWDFGDPRFLLSSCRGFHVPDVRLQVIGFRVVLGGAAAAR